MLKHVLKSSVKTAFHAFGLDIIRHVPIPVNPFNALKYVIADYLSKQDTFFFVQIGANDGIEDDPIRELVLQHNLSGLLVEPLQDVFEELIKNYHGCANLRFEQCAIGRRNEPARFYRAKPSSDVPTSARCYASFERAHLVKELRIANSPASVQEVTVPCLTINTLLMKHNIHSVTLLQIDTEGFDCEIVMMAIEGGVFPKIINYEYCHAPPKTQAACKRLLANQGYRFVDVGKDTLAVRDASIE